MQSEVVYLFSGLWKGREKGRRAEREERGREERGERQREERREREEREREKQKGRRGELWKDRSCLFEREMEKEETQAASRKEDLPASADGGGSGHGFSLKEIEQPLQYLVLEHASLVMWITTYPVLKTNKRKQTNKTPQ